jgi:hypothetical protein
MVVHAVTRPYPVTTPMVVLALMVPFYIFIAEAVRGRPLHVPELAVDGLVPVEPAWALVYGALYLFLILLPVFLVCQASHIHRTVLAYLTVWSVLSRVSDRCSSAG